MSYLQDINLFSKGDNLGGLLLIRVASTKDIESIPDSKDRIIYGDIVFKAGKGWNTWIVTQNTSEFSGRSRSSQEGNFKDNAIQFIIPKDRPALRNMFDLAEKDELVVLFTDKNGNQKVFGTLNNPVYFQYNQRSGSGTASRNAYECEFYAEGPDNSYFYNGTISSAPAGAAPAIVRRGDGLVLATLNPGDIFTITSGFSFGFRIE